ncbi:uncharacterized protein JCM10292_001807 [Rhodotorula paludigena]|uniref:uncharacterized protein n=1 Tax=Rhodotorula paludigena TaxID=86838 RepID=UPI00316C00AA
MLRRLIRSLSCGLSASDPAAADGPAPPERPSSQTEQAQQERAVATSAPALSAVVLSSPDFPLPPPDYIRQHGESRTTGFVIAQVYKVEWRGVLLVAKWGEWVWPTEGTACAFVGSHSSVPVAKYYGSYKHGNHLYQFYSFLPGQSLFDFCYQWTPADERDVVGNVLAMIKELWTMPPPGYVGSFDRYGRGALGGYLEPPPRRPGEPDKGTPARYPYDMHWPNASAFFDWVHDQYLRKGGDPSRWDADVEPGLARTAEPVFVHADLAARNVLVDANSGRVTGLIDFFPAGWYPREVQWLLLRGELENAREAGRHDVPFVEALTEAVAGELTEPAKRAGPIWWDALFAVPV